MDRTMRKMSQLLVAAVIVTLIMYFLRKTWVGDSFSLFTLYTLLFGAVYGTTYGLFSGLLATVGVLIIQWNDVGLLHTLENYAFFLVFLQDDHDPGCLHGADDR